MRVIPQRDWIGINELPKACTHDGQAYMLKKHDDGFWHVSEAYRGRHECLGIFSLIHDAAKFFYVAVTGENYPPNFE